MLFLHRLKEQINFSFTIGLSFYYFPYYYFTTLLPNCTYYYNNYYFYLLRTIFNLFFKTPIRSWFIFLYITSTYGNTTYVFFK